MLTNAHLLEQELISNAEGESRQMTSTQRRGEEEEQVSKGDSGSKEIVATGEAVMQEDTSPSKPAPTDSGSNTKDPAPIQELAPAPMQPNTAVPTQPDNTGGNTGGTVTLPQTSKPTVVVNVGESVDALPLQPIVDPTIGIGSPILDPEGDLVGSVGGGGVFGGGGGGGSRGSEEEGGEMIMPEEGGSNWWIWAVAGVALVGGYFVFKGKKKN